MLASLVLALVLSACRVEPTSLIPTAPPLNLPEQAMQRLDCDFNVPDGVKVICGLLKVPVDYANPEGEQVDLQVTIYESESPNPEEPVVFLGFGPGTGRFFRGGFGNNLFSSFLETRDVILYSRQNASRADDADEPECPEIDAVAIQSLQQVQSQATLVEQTLEAYQTCRERLAAAGLKLDEPTTALAANDILTIRQALGIRQVNLLGFTYATLVALKILNSQPDAVRSLVLTDFYPPVAIQDMETSYFNALQRLFRTCREDDACNSTYPELETKFTQILTQLDGAPLELTVKHPVNPDMITVKVNGETFLYLLREFISSDATLPRIPLIIQEIYDGGGYKLAAEVQNLLMFRFFFQQEQAIYDACNERWAASPIESVSSTGVYPALHLALQNEYYLQSEICSMWNQQEFNPPKVQTVTTSVPLLVLQGGYDPYVAPELVEAWLHSSSQAQLVVFPNRGNGVFFGDDCSVNLITQFIDAPTKEVDAACAEQGLIRFTQPIN